MEKALAELIEKNVIIAYCCCGNSRTSSTSC